MPKLVAPSVAVIFALLSTGCGSSASKTVTVTAAASSANASTAANMAAPSTITRVATSTTTTTARSARPAITVHLASFKSPTGNIGCMIINASTRCDIKQRSWSPPPRPKRCPPIVDYGQGLEVTGSGPGHLVCAGDTTIDPRARAVPYGTDTVIGTFRCESRTIGITCTNTGTAHGFFISFQVYRTF